MTYSRGADSVDIIGVENGIGVPSSICGRFWFVYFALMPLEKV